MAEPERRDATRNLKTALRPRRLRIGGRSGARRYVVTLAVAAAVAVVLVATGFLVGSDDALQTMGFDPDRARLITAMTAEALVVAAAVLIANGFRAAIVGGVTVFVAVFGRTFRRETADALASSGTSGTFDVGGWLITLVALAFAALAIAWSVASLATIVRRSCVAAGQSLTLAARTRRADGRLGRAVAVLVAAVVLFVSVPVLGDMLNYAPDVRMRQVGALPDGSVVADAPPSATPGGGTSAGPPVSVTPTIEPGNGVTGPVVSAARPWLAWRPAGTGRVDHLSLPGPWTGGSHPNADVYVYLPPGYDSGTRRYPVVYEVPWGLRSWDPPVHITSVMDQLIDAGDVPAEIVVFVSQGGGPYPDSECANSYDGREWFERWVPGTVVPLVDGRYRTIATPAARAVMGYSQGGYCAPMFLLRHPDVFSAAISFSGYFVSGVRDAETPNAWRPFGGDPALIAATSPVNIAPLLPQATRRSLFVVLSSDAAQRFYGAQYLAFRTALQKAGIAAALIPAPSGHAWASVRAALPVALRLLASRQAQLGVFGG